MSTDEPTPTEYFGPHAKRWSHPVTGVTYSLSPRDYYRAVAKEQLQREKEVAARIRKEELRLLGQLKSRTVSEKATDAITAREEKLRDEAVSAAWNDEALDDRTTADKEWKAVTNGEGTVYDESWPNVISMDTMYDRDLQPEAGLFKEKGVLIAPLSSWNPPEHQRYDLNAFADEERGKPLQPSEGLPTFATRGGIKYPAATAAAAARTAEEARDIALADAGLSITPGGAGRYRLVASTDEGDKALLARGEIRYLNVSADDSLGLIRPVEQSAPGKPAARHFRRRKIGRNTLRLGLVYIIAVIGVAAVVIEAL